MVVPVWDVDSGSYGLSCLYHTGYIEHKDPGANARLAAAHTAYPHSTFPFPTPEHSQTFRPLYPASPTHWQSAALLDRKTPRPQQHAVHTQTSSHQVLTPQVPHHQTHRKPPTKRVYARRPGPSPSINFPSQSKLAPAVRIHVHAKKWTQEKKKAHHIAATTTTPSEAQKRHRLAAQTHRLVLTPIRHILIPHGRLTRAEKERKPGSASVLPHYNTFSFTSLEILRTPSPSYH
ncbi:hypothetical protein CVT25_013385 [Psilocybe cyanescens]|uniref:Uncharacterized protein n=1 Tax=Psilocybe cyanescens TaxID=93625 RepID=A0A409VTC0_PSICY|nr:hypothetical protein CVT25_013385 [Psilocybe cyanescens]